MNIDQRQHIKKNIDVLLRRKRIIYSCFLASVIVGICYYLAVPKIYKSTALIKYQRQSVNPTTMSPDDIRTSTRDVVETITQQIMSRSSLENIIKEFDLYPALQESVPMEDIVKLMRDYHIHSQLMQQGDIIEVSYQGQAQEKVAMVTNALAEKFIEENLRFRQDRASQTSTYIRDELKMAKVALDKKELIMRDYKLKYYNEMPDQLTNNMNRLISLQEQYQNIQTSSHELERTKLMVQEQISIRQEQQHQPLSLSSPGDVDSLPATGVVRELGEVRARLDALQTRYTDKHPEVKRLKKIISDLEQRAGSNKENHGGVSDDRNQVSLPKQPEAQNRGLRSQIKEIENNLIRLKEEREAISQQIKIYEQWIAATPIREAEWSALTRDYDQLNHHYEKLVTESLQAESAQSLEAQLKGSQFKVVDPARFPEKPFRPNFKKIIALAIGLGLSLGGAIILTLEFANTSFRDPGDLERFSKIPVICAVPVILTQHEAKREKILHATLNVILFAATAAILCVTFYLWNQGIIII